MKVMVYLSGRREPNRKLGCESLHTYIWTLDDISTAALTRLRKVLNIHSASGAVKPFAAVRENSNGDSVIAIRMFMQQTDHDVIALKVSAAVQDAKKVKKP